MHYINKIVQEDDGHEVTVVLWDQDEGVPMQGSVQIPTLAGSEALRSAACMAYRANDRISHVNKIWTSTWNISKTSRENFL